MKSQTSGLKDDWDAHWSSYAQLASLNPAQQYRHRLLIRSLQGLGLVAGQRLLDFGSGQGDFLQVANNRIQGLDMVGFEMSREGVICSRGKLANARFYEVDLFNPPGEVNHFLGWARYATCSEVLEHLDNPAGFLTQASMYMQPGADLLVTVPSGPMTPFDMHIGHRQHFSEKLLARLAVESGLQLLRVWRPGFPFFNLYRSMIFLSGRRLIQKPSAGEGLTARLVARVFAGLFRCNLSNFPLGWQVMAHFKRPVV